MTVSIAGQTMTTVVQGNGTWNTTPDPVGNGVWTVLASAADALGNTGVAQQTLTVGHLTVKLSGTKYRITRGKPISLRFTLNARANLILKISRGGKTVVTLRAADRRSGSSKLTWNGRIRGKRAAGGSYRVVMQGATSTGLTSSSAAALVVR
jgi:hypothetical protein